MKNSITFIVCLAFIPMLVSAQSYFKEGTSWKTETSSIMAPGFELRFTIIDYIEGTEMVDGYEALKMYQYSDGIGLDGPVHEDVTLKGYVRTDGDKVYFKNTETEPGVWYLMYDFGLKVGEGCYVYSTDNSEYTNKPDMTYIKCVGTAKEPGSDLESLLIEEYESEDDTYKDKDEVYHAEGRWIKGLSSNLGVMNNNLFGLVGGGSDLTEATYEGNVIYKKPETAVSGVRENGVSVSVSQRTVTMSSGGGVGKAQILTSDGRQIGLYNLSASPMRLTLPGSGVYVVKACGAVRKIVVR